LPNGVPGAPMVARRLRAGWSARCRLGRWQPGLPANRRLGPVARRRALPVWGCRPEVRPALRQPGLAWWCPPLAAAGRCLRVVHQTGLVPAPQPWAALPELRRGACLPLRQPGLAW